ncbi:MAG: hypothetical protein NVSMB31_12170 [Vulcanimicrobiaceae bacterium]
MRTHAIISIFPVPQLGVERGQLLGFCLHLIKLFVVSTMGPLHVSVQFGRSGRKDEQGHVALLASGLEFRGELTSAIDLQSFDRKGHALQ